MEFPKSCNSSRISVSEPQKHVLYNFTVYKIVYQVFGHIHGVY